MKGWTKLIFLYIFIFSTLLGCTDTGADNALKVYPPINQQLTIEGTWEVVEDIGGEWQDKVIQFSEQYIMLGDELLQSPSYRSRRVDVQDYIFYSLRSDLDNFSISTEGIADIDVMTITDNGQYIGDVLMLQRDLVVLQLHNNSLLLKKLRDETDISLNGKDTMPEVIIAENTRDPEGIRTALLLSIKKPEGDLSYGYRTIFIAAQNNQLRTTLEGNGIYFPRRSGFWQIAVERSTIDHYSQDLIFSKNISSNILKQESSETRSAIFVAEDYSILRNIIFLSNDYIAIEEIRQKDGVTMENIVSLVPVDTLPSIKSVDISDLLGDKGTAAMEAARNNTIEEKGLSPYNLKPSSLRNTNLTLERRMGRWIFKGRLSYKTDDSFVTEDYNINLIPPNNLVYYDELSIPWTNVKDKIPGAMDVFTSPNKDIAVIVTKNEILIYSIVNAEITGVPLKKIKLEGNETIIMAEWATGQYMDIWEKTLTPLLVK